MKGAAGGYEQGSVALLDSTSSLGSSCLQTHATLQMGKGCQFMLTGDAWLLHHLTGGPVKHGVTPEATKDLRRASADAWAGSSAS